MSVLKLLLNIVEVTEGAYNKSDGKRANKDQIKDAAKWIFKQEKNL